jgi:hypothetical protein
MADVPQTLSLILQAQEYRGDIVRQINRRVVLLKLLPIIRGSGKNVAWGAESSGQIAENYAEGADAANFGSDAQAGATLSWGLYRAPIRVTKLAMDSAATSQTPQGNRALWARNQVNAAAALAALVEDDAFNGAGTGTLIAGLDVAVADNTNTYASIVRGSNAYWQPYVVDPGSLTSPTISLIRKDLGAIYDSCGETPDLAVCPTSVFNAVAALFDANRRWTTVNTARGQVTLDAGFEGIQIDNCMFVKSKDATANRIYYLNSNYVHFETLPDATVPLEILDAVQATDGFGSVPLDMSFEPLAKNGPSSRGEALCTIQLVVEKPKACGARLNVLGV